MLDLYRGTLSLRRLKLLIEHTPGDDIMWRTIEANTERAAKRTRMDKLRDRRDHYNPGRGS